MIHVLTALKSIERLLQDLADAHSDKQLIDKALSASASAHLFQEESCHQPRTWQERMAIIRHGWTTGRVETKESFIRSRVLDRKRICDHCHKTPLDTKAVQCLSINCKMFLCHSCDELVHMKQVFHVRLLVESDPIDTAQFLSSTDFFDSEWKKIQKGGIA